MNCSAILTTCGLSLDAAGVVLLFFFGLPPKLDREGHIHIVAEQEDKKEKQKARLYDALGHAGLALLVAGFTLQIIAVWV